MASYINTDHKSIFASVDTDAHLNTAVFSLRHEADTARAREVLEAAGETILAQTYLRGHILLVTQGKEPREALLRRLARNEGGAFIPALEPEQTSLQFVKKHGWKMRGGASIFGQLLTLFSAATTLSKADAEAGKKPKFDPAVGFFAIFNLAANFINLVFGGQKEKDTKGLEKFNHIIADEVNRYLPSDAAPLSLEDVRKLSYMSNEEHTKHDEEKSIKGLIRQHSVRAGEVGLRTLGSVCLMFNIKQWGAGFRELAKGNFKQAFLSAQTKDNFTFWAGVGMVAGKIMGLSASAYDPNDPPKTYWQEIRQNVLWRASSFTEMVAQGSFVYDRAVNKRMVWGEKVSRDMAGMVGNAVLTVPPYPARLALPYGTKVLDVDEVQARLLDELPKLPPDKIPEVAARVTAQMIEHIGAGAPSFSELYGKLMVKLEKYHHIQPLPYKSQWQPGAPAQAQAPSVAPAQKPLPQIQAQHVEHAMAQEALAVAR